MNQTRRIALVTGASSGIGVEFARQLAERGFDLVLTARRVERLDEIKKELTENYKIKVTVIPADLSSKSAIDSLIEELHHQNIRLTVLINNAGLGQHGEFQNQTWEQAEAMIRINIDALTRLSLAFAKELRTEGTVYLLNVGSYSAFSPPSDYAVYAATKSYVLGLTQAIAGPFRREGIKVSAICPGFFRSEFFERANHRPSPLTNWLMKDADDVARIGLRGMFRGKTIIVPGWIYKVSLFSSRFLPRSWSTRVADWIMGH
jgi:uncharacterized protein